MPEKMITIETWDEFAAGLGDGDIMPGWGGYVEANEHITEELRLRIERAKDFKSLKKEMLGFLEERESFVRYANRNPP